MKNTTRMTIVRFPAADYSKAKKPMHQLRHVAILPLYESFMGGFLFTLGTLLDPSLLLGHEQVLQVVVLG